MAQAVNDDEECPNVPLGTVVIGYKVGRLLGSGAYSSVHLGVHQETKARVALKFLSDSDDYRRTQALTEVKFLKELASVPNVIKLIAIDHWQKCSVLVLPLIGADLDQLRPSGVAFNRGTLLKIGIDLISTIEQVHKLGICHRSIKSPNICMRDLGNPKSPLLLIDFGMAVKLETKRGRVVPYKEIANDTYHLRSYAPLNEIEPNSWTFTDDLVMLAYMLIRMNNDTASYQGDSVSETARRKKALIKDPRANLSNQSRFLAPFLKMVHSQGWRSLPKYAALRLVLSAAATKAAPISKLWSFRREEGKMAQVFSPDEFDRIIFSMRTLFQLYCHQMTRTDARLSELVPELLQQFTALALQQFLGYTPERRRNALAEYYNLFSRMDATFPMFTGIL